MKITDWKELAFAVSVGAGGLLLNLIRRDWVLVIFCAGILLRGLWRSFSREAYEEAEQHRKREQALRRRVFGGFAPFVDFVPLACLLAGGLLVMLFPPTPLLRAVLVVLLALLFGFLIWESAALRKGREEAKGPKTDGRAE